MIVEYLILLALYFVGAGFIITCCGTGRVLRVAAASFPIGCCLWGCSAILVAAVPFIPEGVYGFNFPVTLLLFCGLGFVFFSKATFSKHIFSKNCLFIAFGGAFLAVAYSFFSWINMSIITPDSLSHIHPQEGMLTMSSVRGFNSTIALLAGFVSEDRYFFAYHQLVALSLFVLMGEYIFHEVFTPTKKRLPSVVVAVTGPLLLASCFMTAIHAFYVNNHLMVAVLIVFALSLLSDCLIRENQLVSEKLLLKVACVIFVVSFLSVLRLEGPLVALLLLVIALGVSNFEAATRFRAFLFYAMVNIPWLVFMVFITSGKVKPDNFIMLIILTILLLVFFGLKRPRWICFLQRSTRVVTLFALLLGIAYFFYENPGKMLGRLHWVVINTLDESNWGFIHQTLLFSISGLLALRFFAVSPELSTAYRRSDMLLFFYIASMLLIIFMLQFHGTRLGWSDSQNRMLIHFLPCAVLWVSIQVGLGIAGARECSPGRLQ